MLVVETIARIRRERFVKGKSIKEIVRELKVSRNTVRKVLRSGATSFEYMRTVEGARFNPDLKSSVPGASPSAIATKPATSPSAPLATHTSPAAMSSEATLRAVGINAMKPAS